MKKILRLGTRGSPLALIQAQIVREELFMAHEGLKEQCEIEIVPIRTSGDWRPEQREQSFLDMGVNKGLFTKELEVSLLNKTIDFAVHSMKDVSVWDPPGLTFGAILKREDPRDALLSPMAPRLEDLPNGARVGTSSLRRRAQVLAIRPDLTVVPLRGNVDTRMRKLMAEEADATILAVSGLTRLGMMDRVASIMDTKIMLPAVAQGALGIQAREDDADTLAWLKTSNHRETEICVRAERVMLRRLDGSCKTPIGGLAQIDDQGLFTIEGLTAEKDGSRVVRRRAEGKVEDAEKIALDLAEQIWKEMPSHFFEG